MAEHAGHFKKGVSGNPGGRPKKDGTTYDVEIYARNFSKASIDKLVVIMKGEDHKAATAAAKIILERAHGKPKQTIDGTLTADDAVFELMMAARARALGTL